MQTLAISSSLYVYADELEFSEAALAAYPPTEDLAPLVAEELDVWELRARAERQARRAVIRSDALVAVRNLMLDRLTRDFGGVVFIESNQDRKSTFFRRFFREPVSDFIRRALRKQCELTRDTILPEIAKLAADSPLQKFAAPLIEAVDLAMTALDGRSNAKSQRQAVAIDIEEWKEGVNLLRTSIYAELIKRSGASGRAARDFADTFFRSRESEKAEAEPEEPSDPTPEPNA